VGHGIDVAALGTALAFAGAAVLEQSLIQAKPDRARYDGRAVAESVKTLTWRYAVCADPFPVSLAAGTADDLFNGELRQLLDDAPENSLRPTQAAAISARMRALRGRDLAARQRAYLAGRIVDQQTWYAQGRLQPEPRPAMALAAVAAPLVSTAEDRLAPGPGAPDAGHRGRAGGQPVRADGLPAPVAHPVAAGRQPGQRGVDRRYLLPSRAEQGRGVLSLERERRALRVVLVVGPGRTGRLGQPGELPLQRRRPLPRPLSLGQQPLARRRHACDPKLSGANKLTPATVEVASSMGDH
jgi:hypothetical protein